MLPISTSPALTGRLAPACCCLLLLLLNPSCKQRQPPAPPPTTPTDFTAIQKVLATPHPYGVVLSSKTAELDRPYVFFYENQWWMTYICRTAETCQTHLAASDDLLYWEPLGVILRCRPGQWDSGSAAGSPVFQDAANDGTFALRKYEGRFWMNYTGAKTPAMEHSALGIASTTFPPRDWTLSEAWERHGRPILSPQDQKSRDWEKNALAEPFTFREPLLLQGDPVLVLYHAMEANGPGRWGLAGSADMKQWFRKRAEPLLDGAPAARNCSQLLRSHNNWVLIHGDGKQVGFTASPDLVQWTPWKGEPLAKPAGNWDSTGIHNAHLVQRAGITYLFYASDGEFGSIIALATSQPVD